MKLRFSRCVSLSSMAATDVADSATLGMNAPALGTVQRTNTNRPSTVNHPRWRQGPSRRLEPLPEPSKVQSAVSDANLYSLLCFSLLSVSITILPGTRSASSGRDNCIYSECNCIHSEQFGQDDQDDKKKIIVMVLSIIDSGQ